MLALFVFFSHGTYCEGLRVDKWQPMSGATVSLSSGGSAIIRSSSDFPLVISNDDLFINANRQYYLNIIMKTSMPFPGGRIFFKRIGDRDFSAANSFELWGGRDGKVKNYVLDLRSNPNWMGIVTQLIFSPINSPGTAEIRSFVFYDPSPWLSLSASWQKFMMFERYLPRTVNFIYGPRIGRTSINHYVYNFILLLSLLLMASEFVRTRDLRISIRSSCRKIAPILIAAWMILDARQMVDNVRTIYLDQALYGGKSLDEKRSVIAGKEYYDFIYFCGNRVPKGSSFNMVFSPQIYYLLEKTKYYLYPTYASDSPDYVFVYDPANAVPDKIREYTSKGYGMFATYKEREFILKK